MSGNIVPETDIATDGFLARVHTMHPGDDGNDEVRGQAITAFTDMSLVGGGVRWIHVPVNNLGWVNVRIKDGLALS
jgi:hypothetical protein